MFGFSDPQKNIESLGLGNGMRVADFGAGTGFYTLAAAKKVKPDGKVYCFDIQNSLLKRVQDDAIKQGLDNIEFVWADLEKAGGSKLSPGWADVVIIANILFQIEDKNAFVSECSRVLRPGGKLLVIDWSSSFGGLGPSPENVITMDTAQALLESTGLSKESEIAAGDHHWGMILRKK